MKFLSGLVNIASIAAVMVAAEDALLPFVFQPLPLGSIKPQGWLRDQMVLMANGLAGHEHDFYRYVHSSSWLGGNEEYSALNEGFPYWFNGLVPLAYGLDDDRLKAQVLSAADYIITHAAPEGWIGPENTKETRNFWARYPAFLGLTQLVEADPSQTATIIPAMHKFFGLMHSMLADNYTGYIMHPGDVFDAQWGRARFQDMIITLQWMYENYPENNTQILLDNMKYLNDKAFDWAAWYGPDTFIKQDLDTVSLDITEANFPFEHGVNAGQGSQPWYSLLSAPSVVRRFTHNDTLLESARSGVSLTFGYHGAASGNILADERLIGLEPNRGSELCTAVETMYSLSYLYQTMGDNNFADRCELAAFNALPVMIMPDWWAHQYMAEPNSPYSRNLTGGPPPFWNVNPLGQTYGLEPNYPCCTVNHPQGYPKFLSASFVGVGPSGLGHALLSPASVSTTLGSGNKVSISCDTTYPFGGTLVYTLNADQAFDFYVRVPEWYVSASSSISVGSQSQSLSPDASTGMHKVSVTAGQSTITYILGANIVIQPRANDTVAVRYGALLYGLEIGESTTAEPPKDWGSKTPYPDGYAPPQSHDYTIENTTVWSVAINPSTLKVQQGNSTDGTPLPNPIFTLGAPPISMSVQACEIAWPLWRGLPDIPPKLADRKCLGTSFEARLIPYGAAKLHIAEFPTLDLSGQ